MYRRKFQTAGFLSHKISIARPSMAKRRQNAKGQVSRSRGCSVAILDGLRSTTLGSNVTLRFDRNGHFWLDGDYCLLVFHFSERKYVFQIEVETAFEVLTSVASPESPTFFSSSTQETRRGDVNSIDPDPTLFISCQNSASQIFRYPLSISLRCKHQ